MKIFLLTFSFIFLLSSCKTNDDLGMVSHEPSPDNPLITIADNELQWHYIAKDNMFSRDGNTTGYLANLNPNSSKIVIYLVGGGACFNAVTCANNPNNFDAEAGMFAKNQLNTQPFGLNDRNDNDNLFRDWNQIIIPYSTGDVHSGTNADADVPNGGPQNQKMTGYTNFTKVANDLLDFYGANGITEFVVTGSSAGGFGTYLNFIQIAERFPNAQMTGLVDAEPMFLDEVVWQDCLGETWTNLWNFDFPIDYDSLLQNDYNYEIQNIYEYLSLKYPAANFGLISDLQDSTIRYFYGFGQAGCSGQIGMISGEDFSGALLDLQNNLSNYSNWNVYYVNDSGHTFLGSERYQNVAVDGIGMMDWIKDVVDGSAEDVVEN